MRLKFEKTIGHQRQKDLFEKIVSSGNLAHAYVFTGPSGVGKTTFAKELAGNLCYNPILDLFLFDEENSLPVEQARNLKSRLSLTVPGDGYKVAIITHAELMNASSANSLLKLIEEPAGKSLIILVTSNYYRLLPTVRSRVQRINFGVLSSDLFDFPIAHGENDDGQFDWIKNVAGGRIGLAKGIIESSDLADRYRKAEEFYKILMGGSAVERFKTAEEAALMEKEEVREIFVYIAELWFRSGQDWRLGRKISALLNDLEYNLNNKLLLDVFFLK